MSVRGFAAIWVGVGLGASGCTVAEVGVRHEVHGADTHEVVDAREVSETAGAETEDEIEVEVEVELEVEVESEAEVASEIESEVEAAVETEVEDEIAVEVDDVGSELPDQSDEIDEVTGEVTDDSAATELPPEDTTVDSEPDTEPETSTDTAPDTVTDAETGPLCTTTFKTFAPVASPHVAICSEVVYDQNPPTAGPHYFAWAAFKRYTTPVPRPNYVHDLEHGAVVVLYNCPDGCEAEADAVWDALAARLADPVCLAPLTNRFILTPDPLLPEGVRFAAVAWGHAMTSDCFDLEALGLFLDAYYAKAPENFCSDGQDPTDPESPVYCPPTAPATP